MTVTAKIPARAVIDLAHVDVSLAEPILLAQPHGSAAGEFLDTGPPGTTSFVELIESMRAHAPPLGA